MNDDERRALLRAPYLLKGRDLAGIDCLGVVLMILEQRGDGMLDPWKEINRSWANGEAAVASGFPEGWNRVDDNSPQLQGGDVLLFLDTHSWCAVVHAGYVWSASADNGVWAKPLHRFERRPREIWRRQAC